MVPVADVKIVDPATRTELPRGKTGLLLVHGPQVMKCYVGDEGKCSGSSQGRAAECQGGEGSEK